MNSTIADRLNAARNGAKPTDPQLASMRGAPQIARAGRNLITVASGKGGVGKTWFSVTLSHALARRGRRVLLFDGDLGLANVDIQLGLLPETDLTAVVSGRLRLRQAVVRFEEETQAKAGFDVIAGRSGTVALSRLRPDVLVDLRNNLADLAADYDHAILDLAAGVDSAVTTLSNHAGMTIVVVTPDPTSLTDGYAFIKLLRQRQAEADIRVVVNQTEDRHEAQRTYDTLRRATENFLKFTPPLLGAVRRDRNVTAAIREQTPMLHRHPLSPAAEDMQAIAAKIAGA